jgi:hypothetical protein
VKGWNLVAAVFSFRQTLDFPSPETFLFLEANLHVIPTYFNMIFSLNLDLVVTFVNDCEASLPQVLLPNFTFRQIAPRTLLKFNVF